jgi:hypothetical protein
VLEAAALEGSPAREALRRWFASVLGDVTLEAARAAFLQAGGVETWADELLSSPSPAFCEAMQAHLPRVAPDETETPMPVQKLAAWSPAELWEILTGARELDRTTTALDRDP